MSGAYKSQLESDYATGLALRKNAKIITKWEYEPMRLCIGVDRTYTPDFVIHYPDRIEVVEIKGYPKIIKNRRRAKVAESKAREIGILKFMVAAKMYQNTSIIKGVAGGQPLTWRLKEQKDGIWVDIYVIKNGKKQKVDFGKENISCVVLKR